MVLLVLLLLPMLLSKASRPDLPLWGALVIDASLFLVATCSAGSFFVVSQRELGRGWWDSIKHLPALISVGVGLSLNNAIATVRGLLTRHGEFVRTPKYGAVGVSRARQGSIVACLPSELQRIQAST
jgi:hypothetical protein